MTRYLGYLIQPESERTEPEFDPSTPHLGELAGWAGTAAEGKTLLRQLPTPVLDQGAQNSCVPNVIVQQARYLWWRKSIEPILPSRQYIYYYARVYRGWEHSDSGCYPNDAYAALKEGFPEENYWPSDPKLVKVPPSNTANKHAYGRSEGASDRFGLGSLQSYRIKAGDRAEKIRQAITSDRPVGIGVTVDKAFMNYEKSHGYWRFQGENGGGHYVLAAEYNQHGVWCLSSWGEDFGDQGGIWIAWDTILDVTVCHDPIVLVDIPRFATAA